MKMAPALIASIVMALALAPADSQAQTLKLSLDGGLVTLDARDVSLRQIMERWADVGGVTVLNAELLPDVPLTLQLSGSTERAALATLLRSMSGYVLGPRQGGRSGAEIDRIMILPTSAALGTTVGGVPAPFSQSRVLVAESPMESEVAALTEPTEGVPPLREPNGQESIVTGLGLGSLQAVPDGRAQLSVDRAPIAPTARPEELDADGNRPPVTPPQTVDESQPPPETTSSPGNPFGVTSGSAKPGMPAPSAGQENR